MAGVDIASYLSWLAGDALRFDPIRYSVYEPHNSTSDKAQKDI